MCSDVGCIVDLFLNVLGVPPFHFQPDGIATLLLLDVCTVTYEDAIVLVLCDEHGIRAVLDNRHILHTLTSRKECQDEQENQDSYKNMDGALLRVMLTAIRNVRLEAAIVVLKALIHNTMMVDNANIDAIWRKVKGETTTKEKPPAPKSYNMEPAEKL